MWAYRVFGTIPKHKGRTIVCELTKNSYLCQLFGGRVPPVNKTLNNNICQLKSD
jgi:hypothetical protein